MIETTRVSFHTPYDRHTNRHIEAYMYMYMCMYIHQRKYIGMPLVFHFILCNMTGMLSSYSIDFASNGAWDVHSKKVLDNGRKK